MRDWVKPFSLPLRTAATTAVLLLALTSALAGASTVWIVGGGPDVFNSQVQIERNVLWALESMERLPGRRDVKVFFTDGDDPAPDVHEWLPPQDGIFEPLALVFDTLWTDGLRYRSHKIPNVTGTTKADALLTALETEFRSLMPDDSGWLLYIGHGSFSKDLDNGIELWDRTRLKVSDLQSLFDLAPPKSRMRFLFTQCYAGAYAQLVKVGANRCGFLAEAAERESEGCSAAVEQTDYEDYSTYFFAALTGHPRNHAGLDGLLDRNSDGLVSPLEAHFHVLSTAYSSDIPRSTSETLLLEWQPWYLPIVLGIEPEPTNEYTAMAHDLMIRLGIDPSKSPETLAGQRLNQLTGELKQLTADHEALRKQIETLQTELRTTFLRRWPEAGSPSTREYARFLKEDLAAAQKYVETQPKYEELKRLQERLWQQVDQRLDLDRRKTQIEKVGHLLRLGRTKAALEAFGPEQLTEHYRELRECESAPF